MDRILPDPNALLRRLSEAADSGEEVTLRFEDSSILVPARWPAEGPMVRWRLNGTVRIRIAGETRDPAP